MNLRLRGLSLFLLIQGSLLFLPAWLYSQLPPRVDLRFIGFSGNWEKELFREDQPGTNDYYLRLFLSAGPRGGESLYASASSIMDLFIKDLDKPAFHKKPEKARIQLVEKKMKDVLLKKFSIESTFDQLFIDGSYNSYTASAVAWILLNRLGIPCEIRQELEEVFLVAFPSGKFQEIRFSIPGNLEYKVDESVKIAFMGFLTRQKKIQEEEGEGSRREELFKEYFYGKSLIQPANLAGLLYMVAAFSETRQGNTRSALDLMLKSYLLNPAMKQLFYCVSLLGNSFRTVDFTTAKDWDLFVISSWFVGSGVEVEEITAEYGRVTKKHLIDNGNLMLYSDMSEYLLNGIGDLNVHSEIDYVYQYERGRYHYLKANFTEAVKYFQSAYLNKPRSLEAQTAFVTGIYAGLQGMNLVDRVSKFEDWNQLFPDISTNGVYMLMYLTTLLEYFTSLYDLADVGQADKYRVLFEKLAAENKDVNIPANDIGEAYTAAALYYFGKGQSKKAREILLKGLELSPGNELLRYRLRSI